MTMSISEARALPTKELVQHLLTNVGDAAVIRRASHERLASFQETYVYDMCVKDARNGRPAEPPPWQNNVEAPDASADDFPWRDQELVLTWMREKQVWQFAEEVKASGYRGEFMRNPEEAMEWVETAIFSRTEWRELHPEGVRFWKALRSKWARWMATRR